VVTASTGTIIHRTAEAMTATAMTDTMVERRLVGLVVVVVAASVEEAVGVEEEAGEREVKASTFLVLASSRCFSRVGCLHCVIF
jgi:hypothetical protein